MRFRLFDNVVVREAVLADLDARARRVQDEARRATGPRPPRGPAPDLAFTDDPIRVPSVRLDEPPEIEP